MVALRHLVAVIMLKYAIYTAAIGDFIMLVWNKATRIWWKFNGVKFQLDQIEAGNKEHDFAQVMRIWYRTPFQMCCTPECFMLSHDQFCSPEILHNENVHLLSIDETWANFVEVEDSERIFDTRKYPFYFLALPAQARKLIRVPVARFYDMVDRIDISDRRVVWLFHTVRCGSTLMLQVFNRLPNWYAVSESSCLLTSVYWMCLDKRNLVRFSTEEKFKRMVEGIVKMTISKFPRGSNVFWKGTAYDILMTSGVLTKLFPQHELLFGYRDLLPSAKSSFKVYGSLYKVGMKPKDVDFHKLYDPRYMLWDDFAHKDFTSRSTDSSFGLLWEVLYWAVSMKFILRLLDRGITVKSIRYEDVVSDKEKTISKLFNHLGISVGYLRNALEAMKEDSQKDTILSSEVSTLNPSWVRTPEEVSRCNSLLEEFGLPDLDSSYLVPNTL